VQAKIHGRLKSVAVRGRRCDLECSLPDFVLHWNSASAVVRYCRRITGSL